MIINVYNTNAAYGAQGQRVAWAVLLKEAKDDSSIIAFYDADRDVHNLVRVRGEPTNQKVHEQYLECNYLREYIVPFNINGHLKMAALNSCGTCEKDGVWATDGAGPFDCPDCGKKATTEAKP